MVLNISARTAKWLLIVVDMYAEILLKEIPRARGQDREDHIQLLKHLGIVKHRLEWGLGFEKVFSGPSEWGYPLKPEDRY
jgi:hypothetical protein